MKNKKLYIVMLFLAISLLSFQVSAQWYLGHLHQHTGYSTDHGYDRNPDTAHDDCMPRHLEGHNDGLTVELLSGQAIMQSLNWFGLSDHSYCINTTEFDIVEQDCNTADVPLGFTCLMGEELSVSDVSEDSTIHTNSIDIIPNNIFDGNFTVGNKVNLNITFNYYYQGNSYRVYENTTMEIVN